MTEPKCETGCTIFYGGEIRHDKNCAFYPESRTEMYDKAVAELTKLRALVDAADTILLKFNEAGDECYAIAGMCDGGEVQLQRLGISNVAVRHNQMRDFI